MERNKTARILALIVAAALLAVLVIGHVQANRSQILEVSDEAQTLTATAAGRNGPVTVEVIADDHTIYSVKVTQHEETEGIGSVAVTELPAAIVQNQSVLVDAVSGATVTSAAIVQGDLSALASGGIDASALRWRAPPARSRPATELSMWILLLSAAAARA